MIYIGIPTINLQAYLEKTINSIATTQEYRLLLIDNLSTDGTREWVTSQPYDNICNPSNYGVAKSWNQIINWGMSFDNVDVIYILNNDIVLHKDALDLMTESVLTTGKEAISAVNIGSQEEQLCSYTCSVEASRYSPALNFSCFGLTPKTIKRVGLFDEGFKIAYFEDNDYHKRMQDEGIEGSCDQWAWFAHKGSRTIKEGGVDHTRAFKHNQGYFLNKWGYLP